MQYLADNYGGLQSAIQQDAQFRRQALLGALAGMQQRRQQQRHYDLIAQQHADQMAQQEFSNRNYLQQQQLARQEALRNWQTQEQDRHDRLDYQNRELALRERAYDTKAETVPAAIVTSDFRDAAARAETGAFGSEDEVAKAYPNLVKVPGAAATLVQRSLAVRPLIIQSRQQQQDVADAVPLVNRINRRALSPLTPNEPGSGGALTYFNPATYLGVGAMARGLGAWVGGGTPDTSWQGGMRTRLSPIQHNLQPMYDGKNAIIDIDPVTGNPIMPSAPPWMTNAPASRRALNIQSVASPQAPALTPQNNPYVPGKRYGNLRYMGGDPNDEASWSPVTATGL